LSDIGESNAQPAPPLFGNPHLRTVPLGQPVFEVTKEFDRPLAGVNWIFTPDPVDENVSITPQELPRPSWNRVPDTLQILYVAGMLSPYVSIPVGTVAAVTITPTSFPVGVYPLPAVSHVLPLAAQATGTIQLVRGNV